MQDACCLERRQRLGSPAICLEELPTWNLCHTLIPQTPAGILHFFNLAAVAGRFGLPIGKIICSPPPPPSPLPLSLPLSLPTLPQRDMAALAHRPLHLPGSHSEEPLPALSLLQVLLRSFVWGVCMCVCQYSSYISNPSDFKWLPLNMTRRLSQTREATRRDAV